jgi:hypothetical protein
MSQFDTRRDYSIQKTIELNKHLNETGGAQSEVVCAVATGSFGRLEAGPHSDLDVFLVSRSKEVPGPNDTKILKPEISNLELILVKAKLIEANSAAKLKKFDADGNYLTLYTIEELIERIGKPEDESSNSFTSRLLLLLEGRPLFGEDIFHEAIERVLGSYWRDFGGREKSFAPAFLCNDILRLWRTFCVNYEARTSSTPIEMKLKRRAKNYKLKYSRMLTCYSTLLAILRQHGSTGTVSLDDMKRISSQTPLERVVALRDSFSAGEAHAALTKMLVEYETFLEVTDRSSDELEQQFADQQRQRELLQKSYVFGDTVFECITQIGAGSRLHRMLVV